jgi:hypothetical protein
MTLLQCAGCIKPSQQLIADIPLMVKKFIVCGSHLAQYSSDKTKTPVETAIYRV